MTGLAETIQAENLTLDSDALFVFALEMEAAEEFEHTNTLFTGCGKLNAAYKLSKAIQENRPGLIINLGSAGSNYFNRGEVVCCTKFMQRDMNATALGFAPYQTPFSKTPPILQYGLQIGGLPKGTCGTGDSFEINHFTNDYNVIDMEAYALAFVAQLENIPFICLKFISDGADGSAAEEWAVQVHQAAKAFQKILSGKSIKNS